MKYRKTKQASSIKIKITALFTIFIMLLSAVVSFPYTSVNAEKTAKLQSPMVSSNGDMVYINGSIPKSEKDTSLTLIVMKAGKVLPKNNEIASLSDMYFFDQTDCKAGKVDYSFKFECTAKNTVLKARITSDSSTSPCDFNIEVKENEYKQNLQTVFIDENFENNQGQFKNFTANSASKNLSRVEENGNHYMRINQTEHGHQIYGFDIPHVDTGKINISFDTYMSKLTRDDGTHGNAELNWWFLGKDIGSDRWSQKLMLLGTDQDNEGYGMVGHWDRRNLTLEVQEHYQLSNDDYYDSLCFGQLEEMKWYTYEAEVDIDKRMITANLYDRDTYNLIGTAKGILGDSNGYYDGMPDSFDTFHLRMSDREVGVDNIKLVYIPEYPKVTAELKSEHIGNIFTKDELKEGYIEFSNKENTEVKINGKYVIYDDAKNIICEKNYRNITIGANESKSISAELDVDKFGIYYLKAEYITKAENGKKYTHQTEYMDFSVINSGAIDSTNNFLVGGAAHLSTDGFYKYAENTVKAAEKGGFGLIRNPVYMSIQDGPNAPFNEQQLVANNINQYGLKQMMIVNTVLRRKRKDANGNDLLGSDGKVLYERIDVGKSNVESASEDEWNELYSWYDRLINGNPLGADFYEIGNEAYYGGVSGKLYANKMLKPFYERNQAYKKANPEKPYIPVIATFGYADVQGWTNEFINNGGLKYCDGVAVHIYDTLSGSNFNDHMRTSEYNKAISQIKMNLKNAGYADMPIYVTETGQSASLKQWKPDTDPSSGRVIPDKATRRGQAAMVAESYALGASEGLYGIFTHNMMEIGAENPTTEHDPEYYFALISYGTDVTPYSANPSYVAAAGYNAMLSGSEFKDKVITNDGTVCIRFKKSDGKDVLMCWSDYNAKYEFGKNNYNGSNIGLNLGSNSDLTVYDMYTNEIAELTPINGIYNISVGYEPVYLVGDFSKLQIASSGFNINGIGRNYVNSSVASSAITLNGSNIGSMSAEVESDRNVKVTSVNNSNDKINIKLNTTSPCERTESTYTVKLKDEEGKTVYIGKGYVLFENRGIPNDFSNINITSDNLEDGIFYLEYTGENISGSIENDLNGKLFIASYSNNILRSAETKDVSLKYGEVLKFNDGLTESFIKNNDIDSIKIFLWTGREMLPLTKTFDISVYR